MSKGELHYPNLQFCSIIPALSGINRAPPSVSISAKCLEAMSKPIPAVYDYETEKSVLEKHVSMETANESPLIREPPSQRNDLKSSLSIPQRSMLQRMKSLTNASDDVCVSLLQKRSFDLNSSINAYFAGER